MNKYPAPLDGELVVSYLSSLPVGNATQKLNSNTVIPAPSLFEPRLEVDIGSLSAERSSSSWSSVSITPQR